MADEKETKAEKAETKAAAAAAATKPYRLKAGARFDGKKAGDVVELTANQAKAFADRIEDPNDKTPEPDLTQRPPQNHVPAKEVAETAEAKLQALSHANAAHKK